MKYCAQWTYQPIGIKSIVRPLLKPHSIDESFIIKTVCNQFGLQPIQLKERTRLRSIAEPRHIAMSLIKRYFPLTTLFKIGEMFNRDHTTVIYAIDVVNELCYSDKMYREKYDLLSNRLDRAFGKTN
jgi:chromosomal replication initiator protein